jgi:hypothetical protein
MELPPFVLVGAWGWQLSLKILADFPLENLMIF